MGRIPRKVALEIIRVEFAKHGEATRESTRAYVENRISVKAYTEAMQSGLRTYNHGRKKK